MPLNTDRVSEIIAGLWVIFILYWTVRAFGNKRTVFKQSRSSRLLYLAIAIGCAFAVIRIPQLRMPILRTTLVTQVTGIVCCAAGIGIAIWARRILGTNWSGVVTLKQDHTLIRRGPYRYVRHPIYTGLILAAGGSFLALRPTLQSILCVCLIFIGFRLKSRLEEKILTQNFPDDYPGYCREVKALVPFVY